jgi:hypothetical protein
MWLRINRWSRSRPTRPWLKCRHRGVAASRGGRDQSDLVKVGDPLFELAEGTEQDTRAVVGQLDTGEKPSGHACRERQ